MRRGTVVLLLGLTAFAVAGSLLAVCGTPDGTAPPSTATKPPNIVLVVWDTVRADRMSLYGYAKPTTPHLDALAKESVVYDNATSTGMWTLPGHAGMFTGLYETTHHATAEWPWLDDRFETLAEKLSGGGYDTFAFSANIVAGPLMNLLQGFETVETTYPTKGNGPAPRYMKAARQATHAKLLPEDASTEISPKFGGNVAEKWEKSIYKEAAPIAHQALIDWMGERTDPSRPFFAYLNLMEAHSPRVPSLDARRKVMDDALQAAALRTDMSLFAENEWIVGKREYSAEELAAISGVYDASIVDLDAATGALVDDLRARGVLDDALFVLVADHGEALGEHRRLEHRFGVFEQLLHVPLLVRYPERLAPGRIAERISTADLYATVLDAAGVAPSQPSFSTSLLDRKSYDRFIFAQMTDPFATQLNSIHEKYPDLVLEPWVRTYCAAYEGMTKLIHASNDEHALYELATDPGESDNRHATDADRSAQLLSALQTFENGLPVYDPNLRGPDDRPQMRTNEEKAMLEALGYLASGEDVKTDPLSPRCTPPPP